MWAGAAGGGCHWRRFQYSCDQQAHGHRGAGMSHRRPASRPQPTARGSCHRHCAAQTFGGPQAVQLAFQRVSPPAKCFTAALSDKVAPAARDTTFEARSAAALLCMSWEVSQKLTVLPLYPQLCRQRSWELRARLLAQQLPSQPLLSPDAGATAAPRTLEVGLAVHCVTNAI